jgi:hypothetical protein
MENPSQPEIGHSYIDLENGNGVSELVMQLSETLRSRYQNLTAWHLAWVCREPYEKPRPWCIEKQS